MSEGTLCNCEMRDHQRPAWLAEQAEDPLGVEPGACRNYAETESGTCYDCLGRGHRWGKDEP